MRRALLEPQGRPSSRSGGPMGSPGPRPPLPRPPTGSPAGGGHVRRQDATMQNLVRRAERRTWCGAPRGGLFDRFRPPGPVESCPTAPKAAPNPDKNPPFPQTSATCLRAQDSSEGILKPRGEKAEPAPANFDPGPRSRTPSEPSIFHHRDVKMHCVEGCIPICPVSCTRRPPCRLSDPVAAPT